MVRHTLFICCLLGCAAALSAAPAPSYRYGYAWRFRDITNRWMRRAGITATPYPTPLTSGTTETFDSTPEVEKRIAVTTSSVETTEQPTTPTMESTTTSTTTTTSPPQTSEIEEECPFCDTFCPAGYVKDRETGCDKCGECLPLRRPADRGFGVEHDKEGDPGFGREGGLERRVRPKVVVPGLHGAESARECNRDCLEMWEPVCGSDNRTYSNACVLELEKCRTNTKIELKNEGICLEE